MERGNLSFLDRVLMLLLLDITQIGICYDKRLNSSPALFAVIFELWRGVRGRGNQQPDSIA